LGLVILASGLQGCAVVPFVPLIAHATPRVLFPDHDPAAQTAKPDPIPPDPVVTQKLATGGAGEGDAGVAIPQQDRVAFAPDAPGSIPLRVSAVDLVSDLRAHTVGDVITVKVVESVSGETKAETDLANKRSTSGGITNLFAAAESIAAHNPLVNLGSLVNGGSDNSSTGTGDMTAGDTFTATLSAVVTNVNPSGTLTVKGQRDLRVNGEDDTIHLSGVVRPEDIDATNTVLSTSMADLQVSISGEGLVRDKQGNGIGTRLMDWLWLF
jgi:flagellar L-ring protein precursor FlgH